jgi:hypothetical protein
MGPSSLRPDLHPDPAAVFKPQSLRRQFLLYLVANKYFSAFKAKHCYLKESYRLQQHEANKLMTTACSQEAEPAAKARANSRSHRPNPRQAGLQRASVPWQIRLYWLSAYL